MKRTNPLANVTVIAGKADELPLVDNHIRRAWRFGNPFGALSLVRAIRDIKPDVVMFNVQFTMWGNHLSAIFGLLTPWLTKRTGVPTITIIHDLPQTIDVKRAGYKWSLVHKIAVNIACHALGRSGVVAFPRRTNAHFFEKHFHPAQCLYIPHGLLGNPTMLEPTTAVPQVLAFGKWGKSKDPEPAIRAVLQHSTARLVVAGESAHNSPGFLETLRARYPSDRINFVGYVREEDIASLFAAAHLVIMPYKLNPGASGVLMQACQYGKAILASRAPFFNEMEREYGLRIHNYESDDDILHRLQELLADPDGLVRDGQINYQAVRHLTMDNIAAQYWELAAELAGQSANISLIEKYSPPI